MKIMCFIVTFVVVNVLAAKLGRAHAFEDKEKAHCIVMQIILFASGLFLGVLYNMV